MAQDILDPEHDDSEASALTSDSWLVMGDGAFGAKEKVVLYSWLSPVVS